MLANPEVETRFGGPEGFKFVQAKAEKINSYIRAAMREGLDGYQHKYLKDAEFARSMYSLGNPPIIRFAGDPKSADVSFRWRKEQIQLGNLSSTGSNPAPVIEPYVAPAIERSTTASGANTSTFPAAKTAGAPSGSSGLAASPSDQHEWRYEKWYPIEHPSLPEEQSYASGSWSSGWRY